MRVDKAFEEYERDTSYTDEVDEEAFYAGFDAGFEEARELDAIPDEELHDHDIIAETLAARFQDMW